MMKEDPMITAITVIVGLLAGAVATGPILVGLSLQRAARDHACEDVRGPEVSAALATGTGARDRSSVLTG